MKAAHNRAAFLAIGDKGYRDWLILWPVQRCVYVVRAESSMCVVMCVKSADIVTKSHDYQPTCHVT